MVKSKNKLILVITGLVLALSIGIHILHRGFDFLEKYIILQGIVEVSGSMAILLNVVFIVPILLFIASCILYKRDHPMLSLLLTLTLTTSSISIIAGGNGLTEYHFSIFMVIAMIATFQNVRLIMTSTVIFAIHHFAGFFLFPELLCGTDTYSFSLLMIHAIFLVLTAVATSIIILNTNQTEAYLAEETKRAELQLQNLLIEVATEGTLLHNLSSQLAATSGETAAASLEISSALEVLQGNAEEEAQSLTETVQQNEESLAQFTQIHARTEGVSTKAQQSIQEAQQGKQTVQLVSKQMAIITQTVSAIKELVESLQSRSTEISQSLTVVHSISEQTKLLALNASIEAARAGEYGKGFSVVASEIRNLATGTQNSVSEMDEVLEGIQQQIQVVANKMQVGMTEIYKGNETISKSELAFDSIFNTISDLEQDIKDISSSTMILVSQTDQSMELFNEITTTNINTVDNIFVISKASKTQYASVELLNEAISQVNVVANNLNELMKKI